MATLTDDEIKKIKHILDVIDLKASTDKIENSVDLLMDHIPPFTYEIVMPYSHFPTAMEPFEINRLIQKISNDFGVIHSVKLKSDNAISVRFSLYNNEDFKDFKKIIDQEYLKILDSDKAKNKTENKYEISVKDREIRVNDKYIINKPHSVGSNMEFFLFLLEHNNENIEKINMPEYIKKEIGSKRFPKIISSLGFKGEILKAFFPKRGKGQLVFRKTVSKEELRQSGVKEATFLKELELAHIKHSPK